MPPYHIYHCGLLSGNCLLWTLRLSFSPHFLPLLFLIQPPSLASLFLRPLGIRMSSFSILYALSLLWCSLHSLTQIMVIICFLPNTSRNRNYGPNIRGSLTCLHINYLKTFENSQFQTVPQADEITVPGSRKSSNSNVQTTLEIPVYMHHRIWKSWQACHVTVSKLF